MMSMTPIAQRLTQVFNMSWHHTSCNPTLGTIMRSRLQVARRIITEFKITEMLSKIMKKCPSPYFYEGEVIGEDDTHATLFVASCEWGARG